MSHSEIIELPSNPSLSGLRVCHHDLIYSHSDGTPLRMQLLLPAERKRRYPVFLFLQGSGWTSPNVYAKLPMFSDFTRHGFAVALFEHRSNRAGHPAPAFLIDTKTAIRYLKANADLFSLDKDRFLFGGSSSGGNTALLVGQTENDPRYRTDEYPDEREDVLAIFSSCPPTDLVRYFGVDQDPSRLYPGKNEWLDRFCGNTTGEDRLTLLRDMSPQRVFEERKVMKPTLLLHGTADKLVPERESAEMYRSLSEGGCPVTYLRINGAPHDGGGLYSEDVYGRVLAFLRENAENE